MSDTITGYARCSTGKQDLAAQRQALLGFGVPGSRIYLALHEDGERTIAELAELFGVGRSTGYRAALDAAREVRRWQQLSDLLHRWRLRATAYADPQFEVSAQAARDARPQDLTPVPGWADRR